MIYNRLPEGHLGEATLSQISLTIRGYLKLSLSKEHSFTANASPWRMGTKIYKKKD